MAASSSRPWPARLCSCRQSCSAHSRQHRPLLKRPPRQQSKLLLSSLSTNSASHSWKATFKLLLHLRTASGSSWLQVQPLRLHQRMPAAASIRMLNGSWLKHCSSSVSRSCRCSSCRSNRKRRSRRSGSRRWQHLSRYMLLAVVTHAVLSTRAACLSTFSSCGCMTVLLGPRSYVPA